MSGVWGLGYEYVHHPNQFFLKKKFQQRKTALHHAAIIGHEQITELLISHGADVNAKDEVSRYNHHSVIYRGRGDKHVPKGTSPQKKCVPRGRVCP